MVERRLSVHRLIDALDIVGQGKSATSELDEAAMIKFGVIGLDHRHIYEQVGRLLEAWM